MTIPTLTVAERVAPRTEPTVRRRSKQSGGFHWGTGRRKTAIARVRVRPGGGSFLVNDREVGHYFGLEKDQNAVRKPLRITESEGSYDVVVNVHGGGLTGQAGAIVLGLSRALVSLNPDHESKLRDEHLLTRDPRKVERKKYGRAGARRRFQFSKR